MPYATMENLPDFFRALVKGLPDLVWIKDPQGVYLACNPRFEALYGKSEAEIVGKTDRDFVSAELAAFFRRHDLAAIEAGRTLQNEEVLSFASDGHTEHVQTLKTPLRDAQGRLIGVLGIARDISDQVRLREDLQRSMARMVEAERIASQGSWEHDPVRDELHWSDEVHRIFGTDPASHRPSLADFWTRIHPQDLAQVQETYAEAVRMRRPYIARHRIVLPDGSLKHVIEHAEVQCDDAGQVLRSNGTVQDVTARVLAEQAAGERAELFSAVVAQSEEGVAIVDPATGRFIEFNDAATRLLGYTREAFTGMGVHDIEAQQSLEEIRAQLPRMCGAEPVQFQTRHRRKDGELRDVVITGRGIDFRGARYIVATWRDVTEARRAQQEIHRLTHYDPLTGLPNRLLLAERLGQMLAQAQPEHPGYLLIVNLDRFHAINDALGRPVGDAVLAEVARRLVALTPMADAVLHLGADEFVLLVPPELGRDHALTAADALRLANRVLHGLQAPLQAAGHGMELRISIGTTSVPHAREDSVSEVLRRADTALHRAKRATVQRISFFDESMGEAARTKFELEQLLRTAIPGGQLRLFLQPQVDARGQLVAAEALVRWVHPARGLISPADFIPVAEESGLIVALDRWMLGAVLRLTCALREAGKRLRISVNISPRHFHSPEFVSWVQGCLARHRALPEDLMLEVTEGLVIENVDEVINKMKELSDLGVSFSVDDFGTGYSSLAYLKRLPIHELKIDRSFVHDATQDADSVAIISTILSVAHHMSLEVVAEGIETRQQVALLAGLAPQIRLQGYHFGKPLEVRDWLARWAPGTVFEA
ncbi:EAL domain-containing protein [Inhella sp.]|uniref:sensor domain-containing protein n=1 Tax=Inhella sp. TaxID=1921806 RepID=UPI0035B1B2E6